MGTRPNHSSTSTASHHRTRSRMDEVVQAAAGNQQSNALNISPQRGKKRKNRHSSAAEQPTPEESETINPDQLSNEAILNQIITSLILPPREIAVANSHSNQRYSSAEQAFAKLSGQNWTYYLNETQITIGRGEKESSVDVDLGPGKMVSRRHARIDYEDEEWWITVDGRNGIKVDGASVSMDEKVALANGTILEIGGIQMMFVLPTPLERTTLLLIHARQHNLPLPFQTPSPAKRTTIVRSLSPTLSYPQGVRIVQGPRIITSPNGTEYSQQGEIDLSLDSSREIKPQFSYAMMIAEAILSVPERKMQLSKIYDFIMSRYAFYRYTKSGWQNSIRHNLSLNKAFVKVPRRTDEPGKGMKWQIADEFLEEFVAKVNRTMTPRAGKKFITHPPLPSESQSSPLRSRYPPANEGTPIRALQTSPPSDYMMTPTSLHHHHASTHTLPPEISTPERPNAQRQYMPMSSPAPFYRYSNITTPATGIHDRSSPPSSGAIDLAETLVEFSSPVKLREPFLRRLSSPSDHDESPRPIRNGLKTSLGDLQGVDLLRGFEKISSWREGSSPVKEHAELASNHEDNVFGRDLKRLTRENVEEVSGPGVNGNGNGVCATSSSPADRDSQMTEVKNEGDLRD